MAHAFELQSHVRFACDDDGAVVLDLRSGRYLVFNPVGGAVLSGVKRGLPLAEIASELATKCNVPLERVSTDVDRFSTQLLSMGLITRATAKVHAGEQQRSAEVGEEPSLAVPLNELAPQAPSAAFPWVLLAYLGLITIDVALRLFGFARMYRLLRWRQARVRPHDLGRVRGLARAVDRAAAFYFKRAWCLERSFVTVLLMRLRGWPAQLVLGAKRMPFGAHAWVELNRIVVNDDPKHCMGYSVLERC
jgi:hypothetical protein